MEKKEAKFTTNLTKPYHCWDMPHKLNSHILQNEKHLKVPGLPLMQDLNRNSCRYSNLIPVKATPHVSGEPALLDLSY